MLLEFGLFICFLSNIFQQSSIFWLFLTILELCIFWKSVKHYVTLRVMRLVRIFIKSLTLYPEISNTETSLPRQKSLQKMAINLNQYSHILQRSPVAKLALYRA